MQARERSRRSPFRWWGVGLACVGVLMVIAGIAVMSSYETDPVTVNAGLVVGMILMIAGLFLFFGAALARENWRLRNGEGWYGEHGLFRVPTGPDDPADGRFHLAACADGVFRDGAEFAKVCVSDVWAPVHLCFGNSSDDNDDPVTLACSLVARMRAGHEDRRVRVMVCRTRCSFFSGIPRVLLLEFFDTQEEAEARRTEILRTWSSFSWETTPEIDRAERRRMRDATRPALVPPLPREPRPRGVPTHGGPGRPEVAAIRDRATIWALIRYAAGAALVLAVGIGSLIPAGLLLDEEGNGTFGGAEALYGVVLVGALVAVGYGVGGLVNCVRIAVVLARHPWERRGASDVLPDLSRHSAQAPQVPPITTVENGEPVFLNRRRVRRVWDRFDASDFELASGSGRGAVISDPRHRHLSWVRRSTKPEGATPLAGTLVRLAIGVVVGSLWS